MNNIVYAASKLYREYSNKIVGVDIINPAELAIEIRPAMDGKTLAVDDIIYLFRVDPLKKFKGYIRHFGDFGTDTTFAADMSLLPLTIEAKPILDENGNATPLGSPYFFSNVSFSTERSTNFNIHQVSGRREISTLRDGVQTSGFSSALNLASSFALILVVKAVPTTGVNIFLNGLISS